MKKLILCLFFLFSAGVYAQENPLKLTPSEEALFRRPFPAGRLVQALAKCEVLQDLASALKSQTEITFDARGRISTFRQGGADLVMEYGTDVDKYPTAVIGQGKRIPISQPGDAGRATGLAAAKARAVMYREMRELCGLSPVGQATMWSMVPAVVYFTDEEIPAEWFDSGFWSDTWEPEYTWVGDEYMYNPAPDPSCVQICSDNCDRQNNVNQFMCVAAATAAGSKLGGAAGGLVGGMCSFASNEWAIQCKTRCQTVCLPK